jgi:hypothetical protein
VITFAWYPPILSDQVAQKYLEVLQKYPIPSYVKRIVPAATSSGKKGIEAITVDEAKEADMGKLLNYMVTAMVEFREFEAFRYEIRVFLTVADALKLIGLG